MTISLEKEDIKKMLERHPVMSIAVSLDNKPISSVVLFTVDRDLSFYFLTKRNTNKSKALSSNPQISLSTWTHNKYLVQAYGKVSEIIESEDIDIFYKKFSAINNQQGNAYWPITAVHGSEYIVYKISTEWIRIMDLSSNKETPYQTLEL